MASPVYMIVILVDSVFKCIFALIGHPSSIPPGGFHLNCNINKAKCSVSPLNYDRIDDCNNKYI